MGAGAVVVAGGAALSPDRMDLLGFARSFATGGVDGDRVKAAEVRLKEILPKRFADVDLSWPPKAVFLRCTKRSASGGLGAVEVWAASDTKVPLTLVMSHPLCAISGALGPKRQEGDLQIPEGFYDISLLNPRSSYHLSMRVNYPNASDRIRGRTDNPKVRLGGDIMVHGNCVTIGCLPIQDEPIEEVYLTVRTVFRPYRPVPIHIFPKPLDDVSLQALLATKPSASTAQLWRELAVGWQAFEASHRVPKVSVRKDGAYDVRPA